MAHIPMSARLPRLSATLMSRVEELTSKRLTKRLVVVSVDIGLKRSVQHAAVKVARVSTDRNNSTCLHEHVVQRCRDSSCTDTIRVGGCPGDLHRVDVWIARD